MRLRTWFLRDVVDAIERDHAAAASARLRERLPARLAVHLDEARLHHAAPTDTLSLDDGEELLLAIDATLGDSSGRVLEDAALAITNRLLSLGGGVVVAGDLLATVQRLRAPLERPFVDVALVFDLTETDTGFSLTLAIPGRPRSARLLRHLGVGTIRAAHRFSRETSDSDFKLYAEVTGDRANISARYRQPVSAPGERLVAAAPSRRPSRRFNAVTQPTLSDQVERILGQTAPPTGNGGSGRKRPSTIPPPRTSLVAAVSPPSLRPQVETDEEGSNDSGASDG